MTLTATCGACGHRMSFEAVPSETPRCAQCLAPVRLRDDSQAASQDWDAEDWDDESDDEYMLAPEEGRAVGWSPNVDELAAAAAGERVAEPSEAGGPLEGEGRPTHCPKCQAELDRDGMQCDACGYNLALKSRLDLDGERVAPGVHGWLASQMSDGESPERALNIALVLLLFVGGLATWGFWPWSLLGAVPLGLVCLWLILNLWVYSSESRFADLWWCVLAVARLTGWRFLGGPRLRQFDGRGQQLTDDRLAEVEGLRELQVLDLEETQITDAGLKLLADHRQLCYLVLRGTHCSPEAIDRLQKSVPRAWIWR